VAFGANEGKEMSAIIVDTEYTTWPGALESGWALPNQHREVVQIAAVRVDAEFNVVDEFDVLVRPTINAILSDLFIDLTHINQLDVDQRGSRFSERLQELWWFANSGKLPVICMNADEAVMHENCRINNIEFPFENSWHRLRPYLEKRGIDLRNLSSGDLHRLTPHPLEGGHTHYALHDVKSMARFLQYAGATIDDLPTGAPSVDPRSAEMEARM
jgi:inhibitor of KinA sporulation pathway (predicted exonuclease)